MVDVSMEDRISLSLAQILRLLVEKTPSLKLKQVLNHFYPNFLDGS